MSYTAPESSRRNDRPPIPSDAAPPSGAVVALRPTVHQRPLVSPRLWQDSLAGLGYPHHHRYVRRYWTAVIGPGAVADLLRLAAAARRGRRLPRPLHLAVLAREGLVSSADGMIMVRATVPPLSPSHIVRLPPSLREDHRRYRWRYPHRPN